MSAVLSQSERAGSRGTSQVESRGARALRATAWTCVMLPCLAFMALFFLWPVVAILARGLSIEAFSQVLPLARTWRIVVQTVGMAAAATVASVVLGLPLAFVCYRLRLPGVRLLRAVVAVPFALPTVVVGVAFRALLDQGGWLGFLGIGKSVTAVVLAMVFFNISVVVRTVGSLWERVGELSDAARTLGANPAQAFLSVTLPQLGPAVAAAAGVVFLYCSTSFGIVQTLGRPGYGTLESETYVRATAYLDLSSAAVLSLLQLAIVGLALAVSRLLTRRSEAAQRMSAAGPRMFRREDLPIVVFALATTLLVLVAPLAALVVRAFSYDGAPSLHYFLLLGTSGSGFSGATTALAALDHSVKIALDAAVAATVIGLPLAFALAARPQTMRWRRAQAALDGLMLLPLGVSSVIVGFGFLVTWGASGLNSALVVPLAQAVVALPLVVRSLVPVLRAIDPRLREAAATLGASPARILFTVDLPLVARGVATAFAFAFAISLGEFGATSFLASPTYQTLPVIISRLLSRPGADNYGMALAASCVLALIVALVMGTSELVASGISRDGGRSARVNKTEERQP